MLRKLYGTNKHVDDFTKSLVKIETFDSGWSIKYLDEKKNETWLRYVIDLDRGYFYSLMLIEPRLNTEELIEIALNSEYNDEVHASAVRLMLDEKENYLPYRQQLIERVEEYTIPKLKKGEKKRIKTIIQSAELISEWNRREILGKHISEINQDAKFFNHISYKAKEILEKIK
ncbi:hypothetical protein SAMN05192588_1351 [Nonlabens sp. Hel1_33_55]|uniref:hypothetical protein n=1 Tax=Nonlabens sp. Hel1_33_55 TaxID=1336802 RepID=UPI000875D063|nr:hypothetical protein [Nonlabens sp. Hel1_33_55]SCY14143.1 hypothetical protein SAMN05192588_1351 [Nonlabens sp. Hel1_33_55]